MLELRLLEPLSSRTAKVYISALRNKLDRDFPQKLDSDQAWGRLYLHLRERPPPGGERPLRMSDGSGDAENLEPLAC